MKKTDLDIQNENAILLAIAIADGYYPMGQKEYDKKFSDKMKLSGSSNYKEAFNFAYAGMPHYVGDEAIYSGIMSLVKDKDIIDFSLGNNKQFKDEYTDVAKQIISGYVADYMPDNTIDVDGVLEDKETLYGFLYDYVAPQLLKERMEIRRGEISDNNRLKDFFDKKVLDILFEYKFKSFEHIDRARGNKDMNFYSLTHGMIDSVLDLYDSVRTSFDEYDIDLRAISPYPNEEIGMKLPDGMSL